MVAHFFNCILAPNDFIKRMDDGTVKNIIFLMKDRTIENQEQGKKIQLEEATKAKEREKNISKKEKRRQKDALKQEQESLK